MFQSPLRAVTLALLLVVGSVLLATCSGSRDVLYVQEVVSEAQRFAGQEITVDGAYVWRPSQAENPSISVLALGVSTLDNGLDAKPIGDEIVIWLDEFPADVTTDLHRPGDAVYGFVRVTGVFETGGGFGPNESYAHRLQVIDAQPIERVQYIEHTIEDRSLGEGKVSFFELQENPEAYNGQRVTTQGYYFWNSVIWVMAEGIAVEETGSSPQPMGTPIWMEGFPPDQSAQLNVGPNNSFVWGLVEVTGTFQTGGGFGKDGAYQSILFVESATPLMNQ
ncbi:MAG: hypothetical protein HC893_03595 [Chloroflexaceae bacterium]|nr:hypothetical protein [Chloroflexaceae bacterium]NJL33089.1 hypothetical protein [Chloroflexaceae bacterium]NJO06048.1 hypothetical protein [Chloroflexaceae bacterium]